MPPFLGCEWGSSYLPQVTVEVGCAPMKASPVPGAQQVLPQNREESSSYSGSRTLLGTEDPTVN